MKADVEAAGGVVWRRTQKGRIKVLLVHRPKHADWSFPKGKLDPGEDHRSAALREVREETGLRCRLGIKLSTVRYTVGAGKSKRVKYWMMEPRKGRFRPNSEVDKVAWLTPKDARRRLTHDIDRGVLADALKELKSA